MKYNALSLYEDLESIGIDVYDWNVKGAAACTLSSEECTSVFINPVAIKSDAEETCLLAHELGHIMTGSTHKVCSPLDLVEKHEYKANRFAINRLLPFYRLNEAFQLGLKEIWELADYLNLPEDFISMALNHYGLIDV